MAFLLLGCLVLAGRAAPKSVIGAVVARRVSMVSLAQQLDTLRPFLPKGILATYVLPEMNAMLVKADSDATLQQFARLIDALDQPVKQVMVEVMLVQLTAKDAQNLGTSWETAGVPVSATSNNGGGAAGNSGFRYARGNCKAGLSAMEASSKAKLVTAPSVLVQDGEQAQIIIADPDNGVRMLQLDKVTVSPKNDVTVQLEPLVLDPSVQAMIPVVRVRCGETILLGALNGNSTRGDKTHPPLVRVVPVLGGLLGSSNTASTTPITAVFLTTTAVNPAPLDTDDFKAWATPPPRWGG